jgi:hypothetical protein
MGAASSLLDMLTESGVFHFNHLVIRDIDNTPVIQVNDPEMVEQEICLFHENVGNGDEYVERLHDFIQSGVQDRRPSPVARFADGEYAFYRYSLHCNGLYQQAESVEAIRTAMPLHVEAFKILAERGKLAPLIFPGNTRKKEKGFFSLLRRSKSDDSALGFIDFLSSQGIPLTESNYIPFYVIYAYLTSQTFADFMSGRKICIVNSEFNRESCTRWFSTFSSRPKISFAEIPASYVATQWTSMKKGVLGRIPVDTDLCLVGAGVGALMACVDIAIWFSIPAIDAGHVLNIMNGREDKSGGPRLYTIWNK